MQGNHTALDVPNTKPAAVWPPIWAGPWVDPHGETVYAIHCWVLTIGRERFGYWDCPGSGRRHIRAYPFTDPPPKCCWRGADGLRLHLAIRPDAFTSRLRGARRLRRPLRVLREWAMGWLNEADRLSEAAR